MSEHIHIRWMIRRDMPDVLAIEQASFAMPWSDDDFVRSLRQRNCIGMVAERDERIVGYMLYFLHRSRLELVNLAVHPDHRRTGVGRAMLEKLFSKMDRQRRTNLVARVADFNTLGHVFFRALGLRCEAIERGYFPAEQSSDLFGDETDAYVFVRRLDSAESFA